MTKARTLADNFAADINGITAGTGITGGGTSGTVTITNDMATAINAKGDLVVGTGADAYARLAVASTAGYLLSVDSAEATGLKWAAPAGGGGWTQIGSTITLNGASNYTINTTTGYRNWVIELDDPYGVSGDINPYIFFNGDTTVANYRGCVVRTIASGFQSAAIDTATVFYFSLNPASTNDSYCQIQVFDPDATTHRKGYQCNSVITESGSAPQVSTVMFQWENAAAITSVRVQTDTGVNFAGGTFKIWGLK